jgi:type IV pilus assembly protein PilX
MVSSRNNAARQHGFVLMTALIFLFLLSMLAFAAMKTDLTEQQVSTNMNDRAYAMQLAESALKDGESKVTKLSSANFSLGCSASAGLCLPATSSCTVEAWQRASNGSCTAGADGSQVFDAPGSTCIAYSLPSGSLARNPCYIIELLASSYQGGGTLYRVTARAWGINGNTKVTLQSVMKVG